MICFHSLKYWYLLQCFWKKWLHLLRCDLLSFFEILIFVTVTDVCASLNLLLWFAFILWNIDICYSSDAKFLIRWFVVICFHSLKYWYLLQLNEMILGKSQGCDLLSFFEILIFVTVQKKFISAIASCDLLSFFEILIFVTVRKRLVYVYQELWFAFILWNIDICYSLWAVQCKIF